MNKLRTSLQSKLILTYLAVALIVVLVVSFLIRFTSGQSLMNLVTEQQTALLSEAVQTYYTTNGSLDGFVAYYFRPGGGNPGDPQPIVPDQPPRSRDLRGILGLVDTGFRAVLPTLNYSIGQVVPVDRIKSKIAVEVDGETVAWILPDTSNAFKLSPEEQLFLERSTLAIGLAALAGMTAAVIIGYLLAGRLLQPIRHLTQASQALARGELRQQVPITSHDELGLLTVTFNQMSADLVAADEQRKRITADITHDLSTPLQIISGYIEMLESGDVTLTPQRIEIIKTEIEHLRRLVSDLKTLSLVEGGGLEIQLQPVPPSVLLERIYHTYHPIAAGQHVNLVIDSSEATPPILVDEGRILQVLKNLLDNALRYTPAGGQITLSAASGQEVILKVTDSGSGIEPEDLPYVFERFYQADKARNANAGKMGLGLAICKALVDAQGGAITAESAGKGQGTTMSLHFAPAGRASEKA